MLQRARIRGVGIALSLYQPIRQVSPRSGISQSSVRLGPPVHDRPDANVKRVGYDWASEGHAEFLYENVKIPAGNVILGPGEGKSTAYAASLCQSLTEYPLGFTIASV